MKHTLAITSLALLFSCGETTTPVVETDETTTSTETTVESENIPPEENVEVVTSDIYMAENQKGVMLLCHQATWSRGEYIETAPKFAKMGYTCLAIDQRSGGAINDVTNNLARQHDQKTTIYADAVPDIEKGIDEAFALNNNQPIILVGSSYSASLVLLLGHNNPKVKSIISFSPGEYLEGYSLADSIAGLTKDLYIASSKSEYPATIDLISNIGNPNTMTHFFPQEGEGEHGSKALWQAMPDHVEYWNSLEEFLAHSNGEIYD